MKELGGITRQSPTQRQQGISNFVNRVLNNPEALAHLEAWGLGLDTEPVKVTARQLPQEKIIFNTA